MHVCLPLARLHVGGIVLEVAVANVSEGQALLDEGVRGDLCIDHSLEVLQSLHLDLLRGVLVKLHWDTWLASCVIEENSDLDVVGVLQESGLSCLGRLLGPVELDVNRGGRKGALDVIPAQSTVEGAKDLVVRDVHHETRQLVGLIRVVNSKVLPESGELVDFHGLVGEEVLGEFGELRHELVRNELPLDVEGQAGLIDPAIQPGATVGTVKVLRLELK